MAEIYIGGIDIDRLNLAGFVYNYPEGTNPPYSVEPMGAFIDASRTHTPLAPDFYVLNSWYQWRLNHALATGAPSETWQRKVDAFQGLVNNIPSIHVAVFGALENNDKYQFYHHWIWNRFPGDQSNPFTRASGIPWFTDIPDPPLDFDNYVLYFNEFGTPPPYSFFVPSVSRGTDILRDVQGFMYDVVPVVVGTAFTLFGGSSGEAILSAQEVAARAAASQATDTPPETVPQSSTIEEFAAGPVLAVAGLGILIFLFLV